MIGQKRNRAAQKINPWQNFEIMINATLLVKKTRFSSSPMAPSMYLIVALGCTLLLEPLVDTIWLSCVARACVHQAVCLQPLT